MHKLRNLRLSLLLFMLMLGVTYASPILCSSTLLNNNVYTTVASFSSIALSMAIFLSAVSLLVSFVFISIIYIVSKIFPETKIGSFLGNEYRELVKSILIIVIIYAAISFVSGIAVSFTGASIGNFATNTGNLLYNSEVYLCGVNNVLMQSIESLTSLSLADGIFKGLLISWGGLPIPPVPIPGPLGLILPVVKSGVSFSLLKNNILQTDFVSGSQFTTSMMNDLFNYIYFPAVNIITVQISVLPIFEILGLWVLIPLGIIFRALPFVRGIGGTLIAFGIGIALIWPSVLVLFNAPVSNFFYGYLSVHGEVPLSTGCSSLGLVSSICNGLSNFVYFETSGVAGGSITSGTINSFTLAFSTLFSIYPSLNYILQNTLYILFQIFIVFMFDLVITYTITDNIARLLGGSISLSVSKKLKLV